MWPPYPRTAQSVAKRLYAERSGERSGGGDLGDTAFPDPMAMLLAYLRSPDDAAWAGGHQPWSAGSSADKEILVGDGDP